MPLAVFVFGQEEDTESKVRDDDPEGGPANDAIICVKKMFYHDRREDGGPRH